MEEDVLLEVKDLKVHFVTWKGILYALDGVNFRIRRGETLGLVGETGCGKSVTALSIMGLIPPTEGTIVSGHIEYRGVDLVHHDGVESQITLKRKRAKLKVKQRIYKKNQTFLNSYRGSKIAMISQEPMTSLNPVTNIATQLTESIMIRGKQELSRRILSRILIDKKTFSEIKKSIINNDKHTQEILGSDPLKRSLMNQIASIFARSDVTDDYKDTMIDRLVNSPVPNKLVINFLRNQALGKDVFYAKLPFLRKYFLKFLLKEAENKSMELLRSMNISDVERVVKAFPHELSGGMKQRVLIAMALVENPQLLIADEPTTALDVTTQVQILDLLKDLKNRLGLSILFITHDLGVIADIADRIAIMYAGEVVEVGDKMRIFYNPLHPYTVGLLKTIPTESSIKRKLPTIPGSIPNMLDPPVGCKFNPRCDYAKDACKDKKPKMIEVEKDHYVACWLYTEEDHAEP